MHANELIFLKTCLRLEHAFLLAYIKKSIKK